jgi:segment polarity protein dishevelled
MARPNSGLQIKDRKWLKIPILMSFIGHELVNWLLDKVHGFESRKQARAFANRLLEIGLIKHAVNMNRFSEKCYYKFDGKFVEFVF